MTQAIAKVEREQQLSQEDIDLVKKTVAAGATESEFKLFLYIAQRYNLDPLIKQIWLVKYGTAPAAIFTSRDGFLSIGHRSGQFDGMETKAVRDEKGHVTGAVCRVWRRDMTHPFEVEVSRSEYDTNKGNWVKMPETMIKKVAESQCLRRAFDISGLYDPSEYDPADNYQTPQQEVVEAPRAATPPTPSATKPASTPVANNGEKATDQQINAITRMAGAKGWDEIELATRIQELYGCRVVELTKSDAGHFIQVIQQKA